MICREHNRQYFMSPELQYIPLIGNNRIVSFWDMLQIDSRPLLAAITYISGTVGEYKTLVQLSGRNNEFVLRPTIAQKALLINAIENLAHACDQHGMTTTSRLAKDAHSQCVDAIATPGVISVHTIQTLLPILQGLPASFVAEAETRKFFAMSDGADLYHQSADELFGPDVVDAFPNAAFDIEEAGKCQAFGLWTASVMHIMRVLEIGLQALAGHVEVSHEENWNKTLNSFEGKLREIRKKVDGPDAEQWAAEMGTHLRFIKNAWRNQAMHPQATYDETRAQSIFDNARSLMSQLANKIST